MNKAPEDAVNKGINFLTELAAICRKFKNIGKKT